MMAASLEWGIGPTGALVFASSMVGVDPRDRPRAPCPACGGRGRVLYAREVEDGCDECEATGREGAR